MSRSLLESSLAQSNLLLSHLRKAGIPVVWHGRLDGEPAPYCHNCMVCPLYIGHSQPDVYNIPCFMQYQTEELEDVVTSFRLHPPEL